MSGSSYWLCERDGSLRNGREFVHSEPVEGQDVLTSLEELQRHLDLQGDSEDLTSVRTSVHVHIDVRDMSVGKRRAFLLLCVAFEPALFSISGEKRHGNPYCQSITGMDRTIRSFVHGHITSSDVSYEWEKYTSINLTRLRDLSTFEFRMMEGTTDMGRVACLIDVLTSIKKLAKDLRTPKRVTSDFLFNYRSVMEEILSYIPEEYKYNLHPPSDIIAGISNLRRVMQLSKEPHNGGYEEAQCVTLLEEYLPGVTKLPLSLARKLFGGDIGKFVQQSDLEKV